ncbi:MAG: SDR family NAD(P)-dependent oxidoreductase [Pseudomonadota bacterium]
MSNKTILITGCSTGIGHHCALAMKERGWRVFATARTPDDLARLSSEGLEAVSLDYTDGESIAACADHVLAATGNDLFAVFNNGAYGQGGAVEDVPVDVLRQQFEANFFGWHDLTTRLLPQMIARGSGRIVQCSSVLGIVALKFRGPYNASKFALEGLSDTLRLELEGTGVAVCSIQPGPIESRFNHTAHAMLRKTINLDASRFKDRYYSSLDAGPDAPGPNDKWRLGPEAVQEKLVHAVESTNPHPHYKVTTPTYLMEGARRLLPARAFHRLLSRVS